MSHKLHPAHVFDSRPFASRCRVSLAVLVCIAMAQAAAADGQAADALPYHRRADVIYGRSYGTALTMDILTPKGEANGIGVVWVVSGGYVSSADSIRPETIETRCGALLRRGYTVFAVVHGSQPKFTIPEAVKDINRAMRHIRHHAADYSIEPDRIGIFGSSAGGHLSLMQGIAPQPPDTGHPDPVEHASSQTQAVAVYYPPTDFLNFGEEGRINLGTERLTRFRAAFDFVSHDEQSRRLVLITDEQQRIEIGRTLSPIYYVSPTDAPTLIVHGDADKLVPIQQAHLLIERLGSAGVPAKLITKPGAAHGWRGMDKDAEAFADWFDEHLSPIRPRTKEENPQQGR